ncbi:unnamed protein product [Bursaphelenchus xylophilus]|uniref:(pine wood nematode) hypothetical protein n=1 Tax=Bursaphelenchus xylophilus TaxID=6326 RepID=A0A1I7S7H4_BURXY|nr:unnamed protein product [Bursaphelenchus xylophilus]CAG9085096.1 unnamed protein product [Bursaphelenchus xylophilus]
MDNGNENVELSKEDEELYGSEIKSLSVKEQQLFKLRLYRRRLRRTDELIRWQSDMTEEELGTAVYELFELGYAAGEPSITYVQKIWNSVTAFFKAKGVPEYQRCTAKFFTNRFLPSLRQRLAFDSAGEALRFAVVQRQFYILLRFMALIYSPCVYQEIELIPILRFIYLMDSPKSLKCLMDEVLCDEFFLVLPHYLAAIYEDLEMTAPLDLIKYGSLENSVEETEEMEPNTSGASNVLNAVSLMKEDPDESECANDSFNDSFKERNVVAISESGASDVYQAMRCVLETPEKNAETCLPISVTVSQTPIRAMAKTTNVKVGQLRELLVPRTTVESRKRKTEDFLMSSQKKSNRMNLVSVFSGFV